jgi:hypothetical protein
LAHSEHGHASIGGAHNDPRLRELVDHWEDTPNRADGAIEPKFANGRYSGEELRRDLTRGAENSQRHGEIETRPNLAQPARREVDRDPLHRPFESARFDGRPDTIAGLATAGVGQADDRECRETVGHVNFDRHPRSIESVERRRRDGAQHEKTSNTVMEVASCAGDERKTNPTGGL